MKDFGHFATSMFKSIFRISGLIYLLVDDIFMFCIFMGFAEVLGIVEEFVDYRDWET